MRNAQAHYERRRSTKAARDARVTSGTRVALAIRSRRERGRVEAANNWELVLSVGARAHALPSCK